MRRGGAAVIQRSGNGGVRKAMRLFSHGARSIAAVVALALGGCVVGPDFSAPSVPPVSGFLPASASKDLEKPQAVKFNPGARLAGDWWQVFGSKRLNELIELGMAHNADIEAAEAALRVAEYNSLAIRGSFWPTVQGNWSSSRQLTPDRTLTSNHAKGKSVYSLHTPQVTVTYVADVFGGVRRQVEAAEAQVEVQQFQREAVVLTLTSNIALAAIQLASFEGQITATRRLIALQSQLLDTLKRQHAAGQIALPDVLAQETAVAQGKLLLPPLERQFDQQRHLIAVLTGRFPAEAGKEVFKLASFRMPRNVPVSLPADFVQQRPDIKVAEANLKQANAQLGVAMAARLPQITLSGNGGNTADAIGKLFLPSTWVYLVAGTVAQSIFDGNTLKNRQAAAEATFNQLTAQYRGVVLVAFQNVADVLRAIEADAKLVVAAREAEQAAERSLTLVRQQVEQGQVSLPALLTAQQAYLQTSLARVQAEASRLADIVALYQALGGGWWNRKGHDDDDHGERHPELYTSVHHSPWRSVVEKARARFDH